MIVYLGYDKNDIDFKNYAISQYSNSNKVNLGELKYNKKGKPILDNAYISISHTENVIVVAISKENVGIDIENANRKIALKMGIKEWTEYESYVKWIGTGIIRKTMYDPFPKELLSSFNIDNQFILSIYSIDKQITLVRQ